MTLCLPSVTLRETSTTTVDLQLPKHKQNLVYHHCMNFGTHTVHKCTTQLLEDGLRYRGHSSFGDIICYQVCCNNQLVNRECPMRDLARMNTHKHIQTHTHTHISIEEYSYAKLELSSFVGSLLRHPHSGYGCNEGSPTLFLEPLPKPALFQRLSAARFWAYLTCRARAPVYPCGPDAFGMPRPWQHGLAT